MIDRWLRRTADWCVPASALDWNRDHGWVLSLTPGDWRHDFNAFADWWENEHPDDPVSRA